MSWRALYEEKRRTAQQAVQLVKSGDRVYVGTASSMAYGLIDALYERRDELENVVICNGLSFRTTPFFLPEAKGHFRTLTYFAGPGDRIGIKNGQTEFTSLHLSQSERWCRNIGRPDVAFLEVSLPDENGYMSYGAYGPALHDCVRECAGRMVVQVNADAPYVLGEKSLIHVSQVDAIVEQGQKLDEVPNLPADETLTQISDFIVEHVPDGATLQLGLGGVSNAVGFGLRNKNDLGVHTEMYTDSMMELTKLGVINNRRKTFMPGKAVTAFALGTRALYDFVDHNEGVYFAPFSTVNDPCTIAKNDRMISINTAMAVDLYGQVAADCMGYHQQSATGGQLDYVRGAQMSRGGKSFIALASTHGGKQGRTSRIVSALPTGSAVTTPRSDVQYIVTEYGCVDLSVLSMQDRARALIRIAHPDFRDELTEQAKAAGLL